MALSEISFAIVDGGLGIIPTDTTNLQVTMGCCSAGTPGTFYALGSLRAVTQYLGYGPLAEAVALKMANGASVQYAYVLPQTNTGAFSSAVTHYGTGYGTVAVSAVPNQAITVLCTTAGAFATARFTFALGGGAASQPVTSGASAWSYLVPGTSTTLTFTAAGGTQSFSVGDTWTISTTGTVTAGGSNVTTNAVTQSSQVFDQYQGVVKFPATGTFGSGTFQWALDYRVLSDGTDISNYSAPIIIPTGGKYNIPNSGICLTFAQPTVLVKITTGGALGTMAFDVNVGGAGYSGVPVTTSATATTSYAVAGTNVSIVFSAATYTLNDVWTISALGAVTHSTGVGAGSVTATSASFVSGDYNTFLSAPPSPSNSDITAGFAALIADTTYQWSIAQVVGVPVSASAAATTESTCDSAATTAFGAYRFIRVLSECPTTGSIIVSGGNAVADTADTDSVIAAAFASTQSTQGRTQVGAGDFDCISPLTGYYQRRNGIWAEAARLNITQIKDDPGKTANGSISFCRTIYRNEAVTPGLDAARLVTLRTYQGIPGFYITAGPTLALSTSDFGQIPNCRVIDRACVISYAALFPFLRSDVPVDEDTGFILASAKAKIEGIVLTQLEAGLTNNGQASAVNFEIDGSANLLSSPILPCTVTVTPVAYFYEIQVTIGFTNPIVAAAANG